MTVGIAANFQLGLLNVELLKLTEQHRAWRHGCQHAWQLERLATFAVIQLNVREFKPRHQPTTLGIDAANLYTNTQSACGLLLQHLTVIANSRHNENVQRAPSQQHNHPSKHHQAQRPIERTTPN